MVDGRRDVNVFKNSGKLTPLFPTVLASVSLGLTEAERNEISQYIEQNKDLFKKRGRDKVIFEKSPINLHHMAVMEPMFSRIANAVHGALERMGFDPSRLNMHITRSWANYNTENMITPSHVHVNSHLSIVYYPDDSCSQAQINFLNLASKADWIPALNDPAYSELGAWDRTNYFSTDSVSYTPKPDLCLIFPSNIPHSVSPNTSKRSRISIAMDTLFTLKEYVLDEPLLPPPSDWKEYEL